MKRLQTIGIGIALILCLGCSDDDPSKSKAARAALEFLKGEFEERLQKPHWTENVNRRYLLQRKDAVLARLEESPEAELPFVISSILSTPYSWEGPDRRPFPNALLAVDWLAYDCCVVGIVFKCPKQDSMKFAVFGRQTTHPMWKLTLYRDGYVPCLIENASGSAMREVSASDGSRVLAIPARLAKELRLAVYDEQGHVSNFIRVVTYNWANDGEAREGPG
jgi:hypothetical protein